MGLFKRLSAIFKSKANKALDKAEDPRQMLDYSYEKQLELLQKVRRGVADVATSRKRLEIQLAALEQQGAKLEGQAKAALSMGREDLAREALTRRSGVQGEMADLGAQLAALQAEEERLSAAAQQLAAKVESFRTRKETIKATYTAAEAQTRISEAFSGISDELSDVGMAIQRAEDKTAQLQARAGALDEPFEAVDDPMLQVPHGDEDFVGVLAAGGLERVLPVAQGVVDLLAQLEVEIHRLPGRFQKRR